MTSHKDINLNLGGLIHELSIIEFGKDTYYEINAFYLITLINLTIHKFKSI